MALEAIRSPKQILVEGRSAAVFVEAILRNLGLTDVQVQNFGGKDDLRGFVKALALAPDFATVVQSVEIIRDAEDNPQGAFQSVSDSLEAGKLPRPATTEQFSGEKPKVGVVILPDASHPGMLETLCLQAIADDPAIPCVDDYLECIQDRTGTLPTPVDKARIQAFLASRDHPGLLLGQAASAGYFPWEKPAFENLKKFLRAL